MAPGGAGFLQGLRLSQLEERKSRCLDRCGHARRGESAGRGGGQRGRTGFGGVVPATGAVAELRGVAAPAASRMRLRPARCRTLRDLAQALGAHSPRPFGGYCYALIPSTMARCSRMRGRPRPRAPGSRMLLRHNSSPLAVSLPNHPLTAFASWAARPTATRPVQAERQGLADRGDCGGGPAAVVQWRGRGRGDRAE